MINRGGPPRRQTKGSHHTARHRRPPRCAEASWCPSIDHPGDLLIKEAQCFVYGLCDIGRDPIPDPPTPAPTITPKPTATPTTSPPSPKPTSRPTRAPTTEPTSTDGALPRHAVELAVAAAAFAAYLLL